MGVAATNSYNRIYMKTIMRILKHPVTICLLFCCLIISGESSACLYCILLLMGLMHGVLHSWLGVAGIVLLLTSAFNWQANKKQWMGLTGASCLLLSLILFFTQPGASYNYNTFREAVPLLLLLLFLMLLLLNTVYHLGQLKRT